MARAKTITLVLMFSSQATVAQYGQPTRIEPYPLHSGRHDNPGGEAAVQYQEVVESAGAPWMRLHFGDCNLGRSSFLVLTSLADGGRQRLDADSLREWSYASAMFTGDAVELELFVAPGESDVFVSMNGVTVPDEVSGGQGPVPHSLCDGDDDRTPSSDPRVGRLTSSGCTGWLIANGAVLTAGHCTRPSGTLSGLLEFNVPPSQPNGVMMPAQPEDQYPVIPASLDFSDGGEGNDWAVLRVGPNSTTGLFAHDVQGFFKITTVVPSNGSTLRMTGYGLDNSPLGSGGPGAACCDSNDDETCEFNCNSSSQTQQTDTGSLDDLDGNRIEHKVDSLPGNSGAPLINESNGFAIGIHTHGGCDSLFSDYDNGGTWFGHSSLYDAIENFGFPGEWFFVDVASPDSVETGGLLRPYDTVVEAVNAAPSGSLIQIFAGSYTAAAGNALTAGADGRSMRLEALLGTVVIGN